MNNYRRVQATLRTASVWRRLLAGVLSVLLALGHVPGIRAETADDIESFSFADMAPGLGGPGVGSKPSESTNRDVPVGPDGAYTRTIEIQVPHGRLGMTPRIALTYSSARAHRGGNAGAGWSLELPRIERDTRDGVGLAAGPTYRGTRFQSSAGTIVSAASLASSVRGPTGASGQLFVPEREQEPVRYEHITTEDRWVEHQPSGRRRYYGALPGNLQTTRITTTLGTYAWLLVRDEDAFGNRIDYEYHAQTAANTLNPVPIPRLIRWGANTQAGLDHAFELETSLLPVAQREIDLLHGRVELRSHISHILIGPASSTINYWTYRLEYAPSRDTGRDLLVRMIRMAPGEADRVTTFGYTNNDALAGGTWFGPSTPLPNNLYNERRALDGAGAAASNQEAKIEARSPKGKRSAYKWVDFDADGDLDVIYHPAGLGTQSSRIRVDSSYEQTVSQGLRAWVATDLHSIPVDRELTITSDLDRDRDVDGVGFEPEEVRGYVRAGTVPGGHGPSGVLSISRRGGSGGLPSEFLCEVDFVCDVMCQTDAYFDRCGMVDPPPFGATLANEPGGIIEFWDADWSTPFDERGWVGPPGYKPPSTYVPGRDGFYYAYEPGEPFFPFCGCIPACYDTTCFTREFSTPPAPGEDSALGFAPESPGAWIVLNQSVAGGTVGAKSVTFRHWPYGVRERFEVRWQGARQATAYPVTAFNISSADLDGDRKDDLVLTKYKFYPIPNQGPSQHPITTFTPRAYLTRGEHFITDLSGPYLPGEEPYSGFNVSLVAALSPEGSDGCVAALECLRDAIRRPTPGGTFQACTNDVSACVNAATYPGGVDFNAFLLDVNSDHLTDLVVAEPPTYHGSRRQCVEGHRVYLNTGDRWDVWSTPATRIVPNETWSAGAAGAALALLRNRNPFCSGSSSHPTIDPEPASLDNLPVGASAFVDLNADGRVDVVFSYVDRGTGTRTRQIFLNTGTGFREPSATFAPNYAGTNLFPYEFAFATLKRTIGLPPIPEMWTEDQSDLSRLVDVDSDGLLDVAVMGFCTKVGNQPATCTPATWRRNLSVAPDLLTSVTEARGAWTRVSYMWSGAGPVRASGRVVSTHLAPGHVVDRIESAAGTGDDFPIQTVTLTYQEQHLTQTSREPLGFERVIAVYQNRFAGLDRETVQVTQQFDVRALVTTPIVEHPLRGLLTQVEVESNGHMRRTIYEWEVAALGTAAVRIRNRSTEVQDCLSGTCRARLTSVLTRDTFGYPKKVREGAAANHAFITGTTQRTVTAYRQDSALWILGRPSHTTLYGLSRTVDGVLLTNARLNERAYTYVGPELRTEARVAITPAGCPSAPDDVVSYTYRLTGQIERITKQGRIIDQGYDARDLYVTSRYVDVTAFLDGQHTGTTKLTEQYNHDLRTGHRTLYADASGNTWHTTYDSFGRSVEQMGPNGELLRQTTYVDAAPSYAEDVIYQSPTQTFRRRTHLDGNGEVRGMVDLGSRTYVRRSLVRRDAFGRITTTFLAAFATGLDDLQPAAGAPMITTRHDGFDRLIEQTLPDGSRRTWSYEPGAVTEVNPRQFATRRHFDWRDDLTQVEFFAGATVLGSPIASQSYERDSHGRLLTIIDADGFERRLERDAGGRVHRLTMPHAVGARVPTVQICHDLDDHVATVVTPAGRQGTITRDELGRVVETVASHAGSSIIVHQSYDRWPDARGRLARVVDPSGKIELHYDAFGRRSKISVTPSSTLRAGLVGLPVQYIASLVHSNQGRLLTSRIDGNGALGLVHLGTLRYQYDDFGRATLLESTGVDGTTPFVQGVGYEPDDLLHVATFGSGIRADWTYDPLRRHLTSVEYGLSGARVARVAYSQVDGNGNIGLEERWSGAAATAIVVKRHQYDALDRLAWTEFTAPSGTSDTALVYSPSGNLIEASMEQYSYGDPTNAQAVTRVENPAVGITRDLVYDPDGWLASETRQVGTTVEQRDLRYDAAGCLAEVRTTITDSGQLVTDLRTEHVCGPDGTRVMRVSHDRIANTFSRVYELPGIGEIRPDDGILLRRAVINGTVLIEEARDLSTGGRVTAESGYVLEDVRGSVLARTSFAAPGNVIQREGDYDAWGGAVSLGSLPIPRHGFVGEEPDPGDGYVHFGRRVYDPRLRRWLSPDPLMLAKPEVDVGDGRQLNLYTYAANNPVARIDRDGTIAPILVFAAIAGLVFLGPNDQNADISSALGGAGDYVDAAVNAMQFAANPGFGALIPLTIAVVVAIIPGDQPSFVDDAVGPAASKLDNLGGNAVEAGTRETGQGASKGAPTITEPYKRPSGATTPQQRASVQGKACVDCGKVTSKQVADHKKALVEEYYETGTIDKKRMRELDAVQPQCPTCSAKQGAEKSMYSKEKKKELGQ